MASPLHHTLEGRQGTSVVVLSPSLGTELSMWDAQAERLRGEHCVLRYDIRGHGGTPAPPGPYTIADLGRDLIGLLDELGIERAHLGGISIGGMLSMWVAAHAPARVARLAVCCSSAWIDPDGAYRERARAVREAGLAPLADAALERWVSPGFASRRPELALRLRDGLLAATPEGYAACCEALAAMDLRADLAAITAPTLVIAGAEDPATPPEHGRRIAEGVAGARFEVIPGARHLANIEQPGPVGELLAEFFAEEGR